MPTTRGWTLIGAGALVLSAGRLFGAQPLEQLGFALIALVAIAAAVVNLGRHDLSVARRIVPERARAGLPVTVTLELRNEGRGAAPLVLIEDRLPRGLSGTARFAIHGLEPSGERSARFVLRASRRGRYEIGPLKVSFVDPFSLARVRTEISGLTGFLIRPRVEKLTMPRDLGERRSMSASALRQPTARGEDFYTLREYVEGDDLRKIHWPSTAKRARYMIRQEETPWHNRATILLDDRPSPYEGVHDGSSFERAVEAAASLADLYHRSGYSYRLTSAHHPGVPVGRGNEHLARCLDALAVQDFAPPGRDDALLVRLSELESSGGGEAALIVVGGSFQADVALALTRCRRRFRQVTAISFPAHRFSAQPTKARWDGERQIADATRLLQASGIRVVALGPDDRLATSWGALGTRESTTHARGGDRWVPKPEPV